MIAFIIFIYVLVGTLSAFTNLGKWFFNSAVWCIPLLPFMVIYYLIKGDAQKRSEAIMVCKVMLVLCVIMFILWAIITAFQN
jgi:hypothetical protein